MIKKKTNRKIPKIHLANKQKDYPACNPRPTFHGFEYTNDINKINCTRCIEVIASIREMHARNEELKRKIIEGLIRDQHPSTEIEGSQDNERAGTSGDF